MKRLHVHVSVEDLTQSVRFYSTLSATEPAVTKPDYAKWMLEDPSVNFAISTRSGKTGLDHLGIQVEAYLPTGQLRSKGWDEFAAPGAPVMDFVFTVCDQAAGDVCPVWPGQPVTAHWAMPDPAAAESSDVDQAHAFRETFRGLENRLKLFVALPIASLDRMSLARQVESIGRMRPDAAEGQAS
jgi:arsenate reductase